jgi:hypothetical protein
MAPRVMGGLLGGPGVADIKSNVGATRRGGSALSGQQIIVSCDDESASVLAWAPLARKSLRHLVPIAPRMPRPVICTHA